MVGVLEMVDFICMFAGGWACLDRPASRLAQALTASRHIWVCGS